MAAVLSATLAACGSSGPTDSRATPAASAPAPVSAPATTVTTGAPGRTAPASASPDGAGLLSGRPSTAGVGPTTRSGPTAPPGTPSVPAAPVAAVLTTRTLRFGGLSRQYVTVAPATAVRGLPLVVFLSGIDVGVATELQRDNLRSYVEASQVDLVYPVGVQQRWHVDAYCCTRPGAPEADDDAFVRRVAVLARTALRADPDRVYLAGFSGGGKLAWRIACADPAPFAAVATYGAGPSGPCPETGRPLGVYIGFGEKDEYEPIAGAPPNARGPHPAAAVNVATWRVRDGCTAARREAVVAGQISLVRWGDCSTPGLSVVYARWQNGTHALPSPATAGRPAAFGPAAWLFLGSQHAAD